MIENIFRRVELFIVERQGNACVLLDMSIS